jgi:DNA-binding MarR family transcriptional regulator
VHDEAGGGPEDATVPSALAGYTGYLLRRIYARANKIAQTVMPDGTHPRDYAILRVLAAGDAYSQQELAEQLRINRTMMVKLIDRLEVAGYVQRRRNPDDRRSYTLAVTSAGHEAMRTMAPAVARGERQLTAPLRPAERERLNTLLGELLPEVAQNLPAQPSQRSSYLLLKAHFRLKERGDDALAAIGLQARHFGALATLDTIGPCAQQELARQLGLTEPAAVQIVDTLENAGLVERGRSPHDRRQYALRLTGVGEERLAQARNPIDAMQSEVATALGKAGDEELRALLHKILDAPAG